MDVLAVTLPQSLRGVTLEVTRSVPDSVSCGCTRAYSSLRMKGLVTLVKFKFLELKNSVKTDGKGRDEHYTFVLSRDRIGRGELSEWGSVGA